MKQDAPQNGAWNEQMPKGDLWQGTEPAVEQNSGRGARLVPLAICAILLVVLLVEGAFIWMKSTRIQWRNAVYVPSATQTICPADENFSFGPQQRTLKVGSQGEDLGRITGVAENEKIVRVALSMGATNDVAWDWNGAFYLQCDGIYYPSLRDHQLEQEQPEWAMRALDGYELCDKGMEEGWVYFVVPQSVSEGTFWMHWMKMDDNHRNESVQAAGVSVSFAQEVAGND